MKYWNKDKDIRKRCWTRIKMNTEVPRIPYAIMKRSLQNEPSQGKFYFYFASDYIWFEREQDALLFSLKYS